MSLSPEQILEAGQQCLAKIRAEPNDIDAWKTRLSGYQPRGDCADDMYVWFTCILALQAVTQGNFGVGSAVVDEGGTIVAQGHNEVFSPYFRSDRHAEMVAMGAFEETHRASGGLGRFRLYTSLESCPMCLIRLSTSRISSVLHAARDLPGGMVHRMSKLPPFWIELASKKRFEQAACSPEMTNAAGEIFRLNVDALLEKLKAD